MFAQFGEHPTNASSVRASQRRIVSKIPACRHPDFFVQTFYLLVSEYRGEHLSLTFVLIAFDSQQAAASHADEYGFDDRGFDVVIHILREA